MSKRCCPVCSFLLHLLNIHKGTKFVISDEHSNITKCALPEWLPEDIVFMMVVEFSRRLREELSRLQTSKLRGRSDTSDTARMSFESIRSLGNEQPKEADGFEIFEGQGRGGEL